MCGYHLAFRIKCYLPKLGQENLHRITCIVRIKKKTTPWTADHTHWACGDLPLPEASDGNGCCALEISGRNKERKSWPGKSWPGKKSCSNMFKMFKLFSHLGSAAAITQPSTLSTHNHQESIWFNVIRIDCGDMWRHCQILDDIGVFALSQRKRKSQIWISLATWFVFLLRNISNILFQESLCPLSASGLAILVSAATLSL